MQLAHRYQPFMQALGIVEAMNHRLIITRDGQPTAPTERMMGTVFFTRGIGLVRAFTHLIKAGFSLEGAALLRPLFENAADACYLAFSETYSSTALGERILAYQGVSSYQRIKDEKEAGVIVDAESYAAALAEYQKFRATFCAKGMPGKLDDWTGLELYRKTAYLMKAIPELPEAQQKWFDQIARSYMHQFVHSSPLTWKLLMQQNGDVSSYRFGEQDRPEMMRFAVPLAIFLSASTARAAAHLWDQPALSDFVTNQFLAAAALLPTDS